MAMAMPPRVIVLMLRPSKWNTITVMRIEIGMAVSEIAVVRQFSRNRNSTAATTTSASTKTRSTLSIDTLMNDA